MDDSTKLPNSGPGTVPQAVWDEQRRPEGESLEETEKDSAMKGFPTSSLLLPDSFRHVFLIIVENTLPQVNLKY